MELQSSIIRDIHRGSYHHSRYCDHYYGDLYYSLRQRYLRSRSPRSSRPVSPCLAPLQPHPLAASPTPVEDTASVQTHEGQQDNHTPTRELQSPDSPANHSSLLPDDTVFPGDLSPTEDHNQFQELFKRLAQSQSIQTTDVQQKHHPLLKNLQHSQKSKLALPFDDAILEIAYDIWQTPAISLPTNKRSDKKYFINQKGMEFLFTHPLPNSLVMNAAAQQRSKTAQTKNIVNDEAKRLDILGRKVYSSATSALRMCNYTASLVNHDFDNYSKLIPLLNICRTQIVKF